MTRSTPTTASLKKHFLARLYRRPEAAASYSMIDGPAWRSRAVAPTRLSPILGVFFAALAATPLTTHAGDLLRGGAGSGGGRGNVPGSNPSSAQATAQARAHAQDMLSRTTQAVNAVQAMQNVARSAASAGADNAGRNPASGLQLPNVPNGLAAGGLVPQVGGIWTGANQPTQTTSGSQTLVNITQTKSQAVLDWSSFNIGRKTTLNFDQQFGGSQTSQWIAYNIVNDPTGVPSQILGSIQANGQVFVVNRNGIIFGGSSQVNTHALFASSLPINGNLIQSGLLANPDQQFLFSGLTIPAGPNGTPTFTPDAPYGSDYGDVTVQAGATLTAPTTSSHVGGRVVLAGRNVTNAGSISTPDGQTILAAGRQIGFAAHSSGDASLRGLDAYVGAVDASSGVATNAGLISVPRGDTMITGKTVQQNGAIDSSTTVTLNGRVDLLADFNSTPVKNTTSQLFQLAPSSTGTVSFGDGSVTRILPEWSSSETNVGTQLPLPSQVIVQGQSIHMGKNAVLLAPGATGVPNPNNAGAISGALDEAGNAQSSGVTFSAGSWVQVGNFDKFVNDVGRISLDSGATIDVSGSTGIVVPTSQNILSVQLRGTELADSPTQRAGVFRGMTLQVDLRNSGVYNGAYWVGTPLANVSGYVGLIQHSVGELTVAGGTVSLGAGGSVVVQSGATINVSGGWVHYTGGMVQTSRVVTGDHVVDISKATPDQVYQGFYTGQFTDFHNQWGVANVYSSPLALTGAHYEQAYDQGANGGTLSISAPTMALNGTLLGNTVTGDRQTRTTTTSSTLPNPSSLKLSFTAQDPSFGTNYPTYSPTPPNITFQSPAITNSVTSLTYDASFRLTGSPAANVVLSSKLLTDDGFGSLTIDNRDGNITIPSKVTLKTTPTGSITLTGANIDVEGSITAPSGSIALNVWDIPTSTFNTLTVNTGAFTPTTPQADPSRGNFTLGSAASLSTAGLIVDDRSGVSNLPISVNGGSIAVTSYNTFLKPGSIIDVSGGVAVSPTGKRTYGNGGSITINSGNDVNIPSVLGGKLLLGSTLRGFSSGGGSSSVASFTGGGNGGSLSIQATMIQIGGTPSSASVTEFSSDFFNQGGFASFTLTGLGAVGSNGQFLPGVNIAPGTVIAPVVQSLMASTSSAGVNLVPVTEPLGIRTPVNLTFNAPGIADKFNDQTAFTRGDFVMGAGVAIRTDPLGSVTIKSQTAAVLGSIVAPGGTISITTSNSNASLQLLTNLGFVNSAVPNLDLGPHSYLSTAGTVVLLPDRRGYLTGSVLSGGNITIAGNIVAEAGSVIDVSGTTGILDLAPSYSNESTPLIGALSGAVTSPQQHMPAAAFRGGLISTLPDGTSLTGAYVQSGSLSGTAVAPTRVDSNGGSITLQGDTELFTDATLLGNPGGPAAAGGTLNVSSGRFAPNKGTVSPLSTFLQITQSGATIPSSFYGAGQTAIGHPVLDSNGNPFNGSGSIAVSSFAGGGFDTLVLGGATGTVAFSGAVSIAARGSITLGNGGLISADSTVNLRAPYVQLGIPFQAPISSDQTNPPVNANFPPKYGSGSLNVIAQLIDVGSLSLQNIGRLTLTAINGDIRGDGTLDVAGNIVMQAGQIYPASAVAFTISTYDYSLGGVTQPGSITILPGGTRQLPLSAAGQLNLYGSIINQSGTLRAPLGTINIGWDGTGTGPVDPVSGTTVAVTQQVTLSAGSITSVSAVDPNTGQGVTVPYGIDVNGTSWIAPSGTNITAGLVPQKSVNISGLNVNTQTGSTIDLRGGGDLYAYQWVGGTGGSTDILSWNFTGAWTSGKNYGASQIVSYKGAYWYALTATTAESATKTPSAGTYWKQVSPSYAVIPGYQTDYAPYAPYNSAPSPTDAQNLGFDQGYVNNLLHVGSQIYLNATPGLKAGVYTLLPARYALLPGAFLVTPQTTASAGTFTLTDNSSVVAGYSFNNLNQSTANPQLYATVAVAPASTFLQRASYTDYLANSYLREEAQILGIQVARLPSDAGSLVLSSAAGLVVDGNVYGQGASGGRGAVIDLSTSENILIGGPGGSAPAGTAFLDATRLDSFGAESLLIGGVRQTISGSTTITVKTPNITVDNGGAPLMGPEIVLVANQNLTLAPGADIEQKGSIPQNSQFPPLPIVIGSSATPGSSDGVLLRVSDTTTTVSRPGINLADTAPNVTIGAGANIAGNNIIIDSTAGGTLDPTATINGQNISLKAGVISIELNNPGTLQSNPGIVLQGTALNSMLGTATLSLSAYSSIDIYGTGSITGENLGLHAGDLRGFTNDPAGVVTINAASVTLDNASAGTGPGAATGIPVQGSLMVNAGTLYTGANTLTIDQYANVSLNATAGVVLQNTGGIASQTNLTLTTPIIVGSAQASQTITARGGALNILDPSSANGSSLAQQSGLGATLSLVGTSIEQDSLIYLPSGQLSLEAITSNLTINGTLDVSGTAQNFYDVIQYTSAGTITLRSDLGNVVLNAGSVVSVAADPNGGNAGTLSVSAPHGYFSALGTLSGQGSPSGTNGVFSLDSKTFDSTGSPSISPLDSLLNAANFTQSRTYRVRSGNVNVDGMADAWNYSISTDSGDITVTSTGLINASGTTGGSISLMASGNLTLQNGAVLTVAAQQFSSAGKGGSVDLEAGADINGTFNQTAAVTIGSGSTIDLSVASKTPTSAAYGDFTGTLHIRAPQNNTSSGLGVDPILGNIIDPSSIVVEGYRIFDLTGTGGNITNTGTINTTVGSNGVITILTTGTNVEGSVQAASANFIANTAGLDLLAGNSNEAALSSVLTLVPGVELINRATAIPLTFTLASSGNTLVIPSTGGVFYFPTGTATNKIQSTATWTIYSPTGAVTTVAANTATVVPTGSTATFSPGTVSYSTGGSGAITLNLLPGTSFTTGATGTSGTVTGMGSSITLNTAGTSAINIPSAATATSVLLPAGTSGTSKIQSSVNAIITSATGVVTTLVAGTPTSIAAGSTITMPVGGGTLKFASGSTAVGLTLMAGSFTTTGAVGVTPATGNLTLGTSTSTASADWDLSSFRYGPNQVPGVLTMRAAGNLVFFNALSDGFTAVNSGDPLYQYGLMAYNPALPANAQSWSYRLTAGADLSAANYQAVQPLSQLIAETGSATYAQLQLNQGQTNAGELGGAVGSVLLGKNYQKNSFATGAVDIATEVATHYQVIRTGTGDITISAGADVQFLNELATIYTAGAKVQNPTVLPGGTFQMPNIDANAFSVDDLGGVVLQNTPSPIQYSFAGGNVTISAQQDIIHLTRIGTNLNTALSIDSSKELPVNWLYRRGYVDPLTGQFGIAPTGDIASTTWWVDFTNYFEGVGALGGGNVTLNAGRDVYNVDGLVPTNARMPIGIPDASNMVELGGGDLSVTAGRDINGGVYYVERGTGSLFAGRSILTNASRSPSTQNYPSKANYDPSQVWLPTTLFLGKGGFNVFARNDLTLGPVANPFLLPQGFNNLYTNKTYFSTYATDDYVNATSLGGSITLAEGATEPTNPSTVSPLLYLWFKNVLAQNQNSSGAIITTSVANFQSWLWLDENSARPFITAASLLPPTLRATAFSGNINLQGNLTLSPSPTGTIDLLAAGAINGLQPNGVVTAVVAGKSTSVKTWSASTVDVSDANPANIYSITTPLAFQAAMGTTTQTILIDTDVSNNGFLSTFNSLLTESGKTTSSTTTKQALHDSSVLHATDPDPIHIYSGTGDISDITLFSPKATEVLAGRDLTDIAFYLQNIQNTNVSVVSAGRDIIAYDANSLLRTIATSAGNTLPTSAIPLAGDIQIGGPGTLELLAGRNLDLGNAPSNAGRIPDGTSLGATSIGNARNPYLPFTGADLIVAAGIGGPGDLSNNPNLDVTTFVSEFLQSGGSGSSNYLAELGLKSSDISTLPPEQQASIAVQVFFLVLRDAGRAHTAAGTGGYPTGFAAISKFFTSPQSLGNISLTSREFKTSNGGNIEMLAPSGNIMVGFNVIGAQPLDQGVITEDGGNINIFANGDISLGTSRIFTLRGGNIIIWSSNGSIAAGSASKTVKSAPPTRVLLDPQSADVKTDLAGLATGGGIGVLATVADVPPGNVDLVAPNGAVDAGDAGIRASGNLNIAATKVLNADNIQVSGTTTGAPSVVPPAAPNIGGLTSASQSQASTSQAAEDAAKRNQQPTTEQNVPDSMITVEVVGYGGGEGASSPDSGDNSQ